MNLKEQAEAEAAKYGLTVDEYNEIADTGDARRKDRWENKKKRK